MWYDQRGSQSTNFIIPILILKPLLFKHIIILLRTKGKQTRHPRDLSDRPLSERGGNADKRKKKAKGIGRFIRASNRFGEARSVVDLVCKEGAAENASEPGEINVLKERANK